MRPIPRIANAVMLVLFLSWAAFQYNDPDGLIWMAVYLAAALACVLAFRGRLSRRLALFYVGICVLWALYLAFRVITAGEFFFEEQGREAMGLTISAAWVVVLLRYAPRKQPSRLAASDQPTAPISGS